MNGITSVLVGFGCTILIVIGVCFIFDLFVNMKYAKYYRENINEIKEEFREIDRKKGIKRQIEDYDEESILHSIDIMVKKSILKSIIGVVCLIVAIRGLTVIISMFM